MKKLYILSLLFLSISTFTLASAKHKFNAHERNKYYYDSILSRPKHYKFVSSDIIELVKNMVPDTYVNTFLHYSELDSWYETDVFRLYLLALGKLESEWINTRSHTINDNGTYDWGYLMLNDMNIKNTNFMVNYGPALDFPPHDELSLYLIVCINYFKALYLRYGCDALYAYNAGEYNYFRRTIPDNTYIYKYRIKMIVDNMIDSLYILAEENKRMRSEKFFADLNARLKREVEFRRSLGLLKVMSNLSRTFYFSTVCGDIQGHQILYDPRKRFIKAMDLHSFYIPCFTNIEEIENALSA